MEQLLVKSITKVSGEVTLPGSKSVSNRALLLAALAKGSTEIHNLLDSDDTRYMLTALQSLGISYQLSADRTVCTVQGNGGVFTHQQAMSLFLGNAGTAMRPLAAVLCAGQGEYILTGEPRMKERPIAHLVDALQELGANITYMEQDGYPPLHISAQALNGGSVSIDGSVSSQFLTALLMAAPLFKSDTHLKIKGELVSKPYIDITLHMMKSFGVEISHDAYQHFFIKGGQCYQAVTKYLVEGDASSASYFLAAGAIKGEVKVSGVGRNSIQGDIAFANALAVMGAQIEWGDDFIKAKKADLTGIDYDFNAIPDAAMTIAIAALFAKGDTIIRNVYNWRVKETDRLSAMANELRKVGATVVEGEDYLRITPPNALISAEIDTYNDHRIAMCFSLIALAEIPIRINDPGCTSKTFPDFFQKLEQISG